MRVTLLVFHPLRAWLNAEATANIPCIVVTLEVSHAPMSSLKDAAAELHLLSQSHAENKYDMSVTSDVSHVEMWPYIASAAVASEVHAATASLMLLSSMTDTLASS